MLLNHLKIAIRSLRRNGLYSFLNVFGLSVGLAGGIFVLLWVRYEMSFDRQLPNLPNIHILMQNQTQGGETYTFQALPGPLAAALRTEFPEIQWASRTTWRSRYLISVGDKKTYERGIYVEPDFCNIFKLKVIAGDPVAALRDEKSAVVTRSFAEKFFGTEDPIGKTFKVENRSDMKVAALVENMPDASSVRFEILMPFSIIEKQNLDWINSEWGNNSYQTWATLHPNTDVAALNSRLENFIQSKNPEAAAHAFVYPLERLRLHGKFENGKQNGGRIDTIRLMAIIGLFILLIACVNFMNLATARSAQRAKEVGVRKVVGAGRGIVISQFLVEAMVITFSALVLAIFWVKLLLPGFQKLSELPVQFDLGDWAVWGSILAVGLATGLLAGSYPASFLSKFQPVAVLKGSVINQPKGGAWLRKGLVTFQFFISIFLIITTIVVRSQVQKIIDRPLGYDQQNLISIPMRGDMGEKLKAFKQELSKISGVRGVSAGSHNLVNYGSNTSGINWQGKTEEQDFLISMSWVHFDYLKTAGIQLADGREFSPERGTDSTAVMLNETAVRRMKLPEPVVGSKITWDDTEYHVVGVVKDFVFNDPASTFEPLAIFFSEENLNNFLVRIENDQNWKQHLAEVEAASKRIFPDYPFEKTFVKEDYQFTYQGVKSTGELATVFSVLAILISCLGLFGLSTFFAERRVKEIGIRKVLGATVGGLWFHLSKDFFKPVLLAFVLVLPLAVWAMDKLLSTFEYRIGLTWKIFALAGLLALAIAVVTVSFQSFRAALSNPVKSLRSE